jgi:predicted AlkP superfamily phosphohydrolase/phosphomutase
MHATASAARISTLLVYASLLWTSVVVAQVPAASDARPQIVVIALDGLEPTLTSEMLEAGRLPNLQTLIDDGSMATIDCVIGTTSPVVWTSVMTGVTPERHGVTDFTVDGIPVTSTVRKVPALWNILPRFGIRSAIVGWLVTWPAEEHSGVIISDRSYWGKFDRKISPPDVLELERYHYNGIPDVGFLPRFTSWPYDPGYKSLPVDDPAYAPNFLVARRLISTYVHDSTMAHMTADLLERYSIDVLAVYFQAADYTGHGFWKYHEPAPFREAGQVVEEEELRHLKDVIPNAYEFLDELIGDVCSRIDEDALVIVLSDHGFGTALGKYEIDVDFLSGNHREQGVLVLSGPAVRKGVVQRERITHYDILPTMLLALDLPLALDHHGHPLLPYFTDGFLEERTISYVETYSDGSADETSVELSEHDEEILDELRSLGYVK